MTFIPARHKVNDPERKDVQQRHRSSMLLVIGGNAIKKGKLVIRRQIKINADAPSAKSFTLLTLSLSSPLAVKGAILSPQYDPVSSKNDIP